MFTAVTRNSSSSWIHSTAMPLFRLVLGWLWQPSQHPPLFFVCFFFSSGMISCYWYRRLASLLLICYRWRPFCDSTEPALMTALTSQAAQGPSENNLCHLLSLLIVPRLPWDIAWKCSPAFSLQVSILQLGTPPPTAVRESRGWDQITAFPWKLGIDVNTSTEEYALTVLIWAILLMIFSCMSFTLFLSIAGADGGMNHITAAGNFRNTT